MELLVAPTVFNKAKFTRQPNEDKTTPTQVANNDWETLLWGKSYNKVMQANQDAQEPARLKLGNRKVITSIHRRKPVEPSKLNEEPNLLAFEVKKNKPVE